MRTRWRWALVALSVAVAPTSCGGDQPRETGASMPEATRPTDVSRQVTVTGRVSMVPHPRLFSIDDERGGEILVVADRGPVAVAVGERVQASGDIVTVDPRQIAERFGLDIPAELVAGFEGVPCLVATAITGAQSSTSVAGPASVQRSIR